MTEAEIARVLRVSAYRAYLNTLIGAAPPCVQEAYKRMTHPRVGDWVIEISTIYIASRSDVEGVGVLEEIAREPIDFLEWDEAEDGPVPEETVYYLRLIDGRRFRWSNASIIAVLSELSDSLKD